MATPFGLLLKQFRLRAGMSQKQLEAASGVGIRTIRRYENSDHINPQIETVRLIADALHLTRSEYAELLAEAGFREHTGHDQPPPQAEPLFNAELTAAADALAAAVGGHWKREEEQRQVQNPEPLPVRWETAEDLSDHWGTIFGSEAQGRHARPELSGKLTQIADVYRRIPSGRLVVVGRTGSGKTILALRLVRDLLSTRQSGEPVPVIFNLSSWDPEIDLRAWLTSQLLRDHPGLANPLPDQTTLAAALIENDFILPVLDGFDEIARDLVRDPLEKLNNSTRMPLVLTSRADEYRKAVIRSNVLTAAACVELTDLTLDDLARYLPRTTHRTSRGVPIWQPVLEALRQEPRTEADDALAAAFTTPLMVALARTVYSDTPDHDPEELLDRKRFRTPHDIETHLLGNLVPTVYRYQTEHRRFDAERALHWHGHLAQHLYRLGERDLAWWRLGTSMSRPARMAVMALAVGVIYLLVDVVVLGALMRYNTAQAIGGAVIGLAVGAAVGIAHGLLAKYRGAALEPSGMQMRYRGIRPGPPKNLARRFRIGFAAGSLLGLAYGVTRDLTLVVLLDLDPAVALWTVALNGVLLGLVFGFATGITYMLMSLWERPVDLRSVQSGPAELIRSSRRTVLVQALLFAPALAVLVPFTLWATVQLLRLLPPEFGQWNWSLREGVVLGLYAAGIGSIGYALALTAWGQWVVFGRLWLPLTGRLPWAVPEFLDDAYRRGVLRRSGVVFQFRHGRLQDHLAETQHAANERRSPGGDGRP